MSIKIKTFLIINVLCLLSLAGIYTFSQLILVKNIENQEKKLVIDNVERATKVINRDIEALNSTCGDWSLWDDTYYFVKGENDEFISQNMADSSIATLRLNMMVFLDNSGKVVYSKGFDLDTNKEAKLPGDLDKYINKESILLKHDNLNSIVSGLIIVGGKPMMVSSRPISDSNSKEPIAGTLVIGKFISNADYKILEDLTNSKITITEVDNKTQINSSKQYIVNNDGKSYHISIVGKDSIFCDTDLKDATGKSSINVRADMRRDEYNVGNENLKLFIKIYAAAVLVISIIGMIITDRLFITRLEKLNAFIKRISSNRDTSQRINLKGKDEITSLSKAINSMLGEIDDAGVSLKENKERLQRVLEGSNDGFWDIYVPTGKIFFSQKLLDMLQYDENEIKSFTSVMKKILTREAFSKLLKDYRAIFEGKRENYKQEHLIRAKNGEWKWLLFKGMVVEWDENSKPLLMAGIATDITDVKKHNETIEYLSYHDSLTGLFNRHYFNKELERLTIEKQLPLSLIMGDVNGLKLTNDTYGHVEGDKLLVAIAEILKKSCRPSDVIARLGGDEFVIILPNTDEKKASVICDKIKKCCDETELGSMRPSISLGVYTKNTEEQSIEELFELAEDRMYKNKLLENKSARYSIIAVMERALMEIDFETKEHTERISELALRMGNFMNLPGNMIDELRLLSKLHDIGKTVIPREILTKHGHLTEAEWHIIRQHPEIGYRLALCSDDLIPIANGILSHHEKWDGTGYPKGLKGKDIIITARIISIIDAYDVITNSRPYKKASTHEEAIMEITRCSGTHFDPELVDIFKDMFVEEENAEKCL